MVSSSRIQAGLLKGSPEINSIWVTTLFRYRGIVYQAHMSLLLVIIWMAYDQYTSGLANSLIALNLASILGLVLIYEMLRLVVASVSGLKFNQVTLYPFAGISTVNRQHLTSLMENFSKQAKDDKRAVRTANHIERIVRLECLPAIAVLLIGSSVQVFNLQQYYPAHEALIFTSAVLAGSALMPLTPFPGALLMAIINRNWWHNPLRLSNTVIKAVALLSIMVLALSLESVTFSIVAITYAAVVIEQHIFENTKLLAANSSVVAAMVPESKLIKLQHGQSLEQALELVTQSFQPIFPVYHAGQLVGFIQRNQLIRSLGPLQDSGLADVTDRDFAALDEKANLGDALGVLHSTGRDYIAICKDALAKELVGILTKDKLLEAILIKSAMSSDIWPDQDDDGSQ